MGKTQFFNGKKTIIGLSYISLIMNMANMLFYPELSNILSLLPCIMWYRFICDYNCNKTALPVFCVLGAENFTRALTNTEFLPYLLILVLDVRLAILSYSKFKNNLTSRIALIIAASIETAFGLVFNLNILFIIGKLTLYTGVYLFVLKNKVDIDSFSLKT